jgi:hypothetical protein
MKTNLNSQIITELFTYGRMFEGELRPIHDKNITFAADKQEKL